MARNTRTVTPIVNGAPLPTPTLDRLMQDEVQIREARGESQAALEAEIARLTLQNEQLRQSNAKSAGLSLKVSEKGALSVYGMGRFPVTLYREQWERLLAAAPQITAFIQANDYRLKTKGE